MPEDYPAFRARVNRRRIPACTTSCEGIQVHGACGVSDPYPVAGLFRDARMLTFLDGTAGIHRLLVGGAALGLDAFGGAAARRPALPERRGDLAASGAVRIADGLIRPRG